MLILPAVERLGRRALVSRGITSRRVRTSIADVHVYDGRGLGDLPPIVVLHGLASAATPFGPVMLRLRRRASRVIAPEAPGHGFSGPARGPLSMDALLASVTELLDRELDEPAVVFGASLGGAVALKYALERPDRVRGLVLASPAGARIDEAELATLLGRFRLETHADARAFLHRLYAKVPWWAPLIAGELRTLITRPVVRELIASATPDRLFSERDLAMLRPPTLLFWGRRERLMPPSALSFWRRALPPTVTIEEPEGWGHCPHLDQPADLARRILRFAADVSSLGRDQARASSAATTAS